MSLYVQWLNLIKERSTVAWLTDAQRAAYNQIVSQWQGALFVNLCGPPGSGKSFIARLLAAEHGYAYVQDLQAAPTGSPNVVLDDAQYTRLIRPTAQLLKLGRVILVTRRPIADPMPRAQLSLGEKDVRQFLHNLYKHCAVSFTASDPQGTDLAQIIRSEIVARGESHVT